MSEALFQAYKRSGNWATKMKDIPWEYEFRMQNKTTGAEVSRCIPQPIQADFVIAYQLCYGPGQLSRYRASLSSGRSGDRILVGGEIFRTRPDRL